jgi:hypothetical protein
MPSAERRRERRLRGIRRTWVAISALLICAMVAVPAPGHGQTRDAEPPPSGDSMPCPPPSVPSSSDPLVRSLVTEWADLRQRWCKVVNWDNTWPNVQDLMVDVLTGPGLHPTAGIIVPGSGAAGGLALNVPWNTGGLTDPRFSVNLEGRASDNGFWEVGGKLQTLFAGYSERGKAPQFTLLTTHLDLPQLPFYGLGNDTSRHNRVLYGLRDSAITTSFDIPIPFGFTLSGGLDGLWFTPDVSASFNDANNEASAPGLHARTTYVRPRVAAAWAYPDSAALYGFSTSAAVAYGLYGAVRGGGYSFSRVDARLSVDYGLDQRFGRFRGQGRLVISEPFARDRVPFYLQPTLGGADINDENFLRGYSDYRFRAPNLVAYEISYERKIVDPLGIRLFGELGKVGLRPGDLGFDNLKSSVAVSITFRLGGAAVAELSFGWSGSEGIHVYGTGNTNNVGGVAAGLRGVF